MAEFIPVRTEDSEVFLNVEDISRLSFTKSDKLPQSERTVKVVFKNGDKCEYIGHRDRLKEFWAKHTEANKAQG